MFLINIGNTNTQYALAENGIPGDVYSVPTSDFDPDKIIPPGAVPVVASVVPAAAERLKHLSPFMISTDIRTGINWTAVNRHTIGADRIANAIMLANSEYELPAACIDFGTAITFEVIDKDHKFIGGSISPGRRLLRQALNSYTAQLPLIDMYEELPDNCGSDTPSAMRLGVDAGAIGMVEGIIKTITDKLGMSLKLIAIGGDADFFVRHIEGLEFGGRNFTLKGILKAWGMNHES